MAHLVLEMILLEKPFALAGMIRFPRLIGTA